MQLMASLQRSCKLKLEELLSLLRKGESQSGGQLEREAPSSRERERASAPGDEEYAAAAAR